MHVNSTVALAAPGIGHDRTTEQAWLWRNWLDFWQRASKQPGRRIALLNGDLAELDTKRRSVQIFSQDKASIMDQVERALAPMLDAVDAVIVVRGTPAHEGRGCWIEEHMAGDIDITIPARDAKSHYHLRTKIDGVRFDIAHHARIGSAPWNRNSAANLLASKAMWYYTVSMHRKPPQVVIRSHNHKRAHGECEDGGERVEVFSIGGWTLATEYSYRAGFENDLADIGGMFVRCNAGAYEIEHVYYPYREATWQEI
jgi:hypothetical protein